MKASGKNKMNFWQETKKYFVPGLVAIYLTVSLFFWSWILLDVSTGSFNIFKTLKLELPTDKDYIILLKLAFYSVAGGAIGGVIYSMMNLQKFTIKGNFKYVYIGDYLFRPFGSGALAVAVFALIRGGIMTILGADPVRPTSSLASSLSTFAIGFLTGFASYQINQKLYQVTKKIFSGSGKPK